MNQVSYKIYTQTDELPLNWDVLNENIFLTTSYLKGQEIGSPANMNYFYIAIYESGQLVAKSVVQRIQLIGKDIYRENHKAYQDELINLLNLNMLCVGNIKVTGEHAYEFSKKIEESTVIHTIHSILNEIRKISKKAGLPIQLMLFKDYSQEKASKLNANFKGYQQLAVQPNMRFLIEDEWSSFDDYLLAMRTKYRTRAKRAFRLGDNIQYKNFGLKDIANSQEQLYRLYENVLASNGFSLYQLPKNYFEAMKRELKDNFQLIAGFYGDRMVSFFTLITCGKSVETGFLGYDEQLQQAHQLYLNMLYKMIAFAIENGYRQIDLSRTALEIKSSVGAMPVDMYGFVKHNQPFMNKVLPKLFKKFYQPKDWVQRNPFKN